MVDWKTYSDPLLQGQNLMGYKGASCMDSGYIYAPYVPLTRTPVVLDPNVFIPRKGILTRYGKKLLDAGEPVLGPVKPKTIRSIFDPWEISQTEQ